MTRERHPLERLREVVEQAMELYIGTQRAFGIDSPEAEQRGDEYRAALRALNLPNEILDRKCREFDEGCRQEESA